MFPEINHFCDFFRWLISYLNLCLSEAVIREPINLKNMFFCQHSEIDIFVVHKDKFSSVAPNLHLECSLKSTIFVIFHLELC